MSFQRINSNQKEALTFHLPCLKNSYVPISSHFTLKRNKILSKFEFSPNSRIGITFWCYLEEIMDRQHIIITAINFLKKELAERGELTISLINFDFIDYFTESEVVGLFAYLSSEEYDEGIYYYIRDETFYYYGQAYLDNPGSFSNKYGFLIGEEEVELLPEPLTEILKRVGYTKVSENIRVNGLR